MKYRGGASDFLTFVVVLTELCISCSKTDVIKNELIKSNEFDTVHIIAHRGFWRSESSNSATNSIASLRSAQEFNLWGSEFDVRITADSIPIVYHDETINGLSIKDNPYSAFSDIRLPNGETVPTLDNYLYVASEETNLTLVIEFKWQDSKAKSYLLIDKSIELLDKHNLLSPDRVVFISFSPIICQRLAELLPGFSIQALFTDKSLVDISNMGIDGIDFFQDILLDDPGIITIAHSLDMEVNVWPVNEKKLMRTLIYYGVDYITTDDPLALRSLLLELYGH